MLKCNAEVAADTIGDLVGGFFALIGAAGGIGAFLISLGGILGVF